MTLSSPDGSSGRDGRGRFAKGNPGGTGNPHAAAVGRWRTALAATVTGDDLRAVIAKLARRGGGGLYRLSARHPQLEKGVIRRPACPQGHGGD